LYFHPCGKVISGVTGTGGVTGPPPPPVVVFLEQEKQITTNGSNNNLRMAIIL
jgi:hypothetical protein